MDLNELSFYESKTDLPLNIPVKLNKLCDHLANITQNHCDRRVTAVFQTDFPDEFEVTTNSDALEKLLSHLLNSSARFTRRGTILLRCAKTGELVRFCITDTSKVLSEKANGNLSEMFVEEDDTTRYISMNFNICQSICRLLHGRIWRDSLYTDGTRFYFEIPQSAASYLQNYR